MNRYSNIKRNIAIVVLGDLGHSPRMCYHALSFAKFNFNVELCGYVQSNLSSDLVDNINININDIPIYSNNGNDRSQKTFLLFSIKKVLFQIFHVFKLLFNFKNFDYILIQNPPNIPLFFIILLYIKIFSRSTELIIDWHNLGYSILALKYDNAFDNPIVKFARFYELFFGRFADYHLTVTNNLKNFLINSFNFTPNKIFVLYDRADSNKFKPVSSNDERLNIINNNSNFDHIFKNQQIIDSHFDFEKDKIIITSTSFTPDEDLNLLLSSLKLYDVYYLNNQSNPKHPYLPKLYLIVTGKGPLKSQFLNSIKNFNFSSNIIIKNFWLSYEDYATILSLSDLGISLHTSSSGLDLPMKILDMFGTGIPVIALNFKSLSELIKDGENGFAVDLQPMNIFDKLLELFTDDQIYNKIKKGAMLESQKSWNKNWSKSLSKIIN
ncbi:chitobiosyldiphosphodolichol beta-1,4 mannosyltransferase [Ascoidea rubescens DSM 1968]|uniref:Chitobiosyldiphosphodolichol beta-mannosyltransferase n=1 Tax=Ascoidea rubescens DSM 1968 TaxID=1344418 RepID=A0A1D2VLT3_9ASCO|nr:glycosyltransferase family 33 protein [Ascoidea rubescens DSM 1968]ODV62580.1 glycosyltransferase family 33 protein [Ascoidea rubescens DSM 1968]